MIETNISHNLVSRFKGFSWAASITIICLGCFVLLGWVFDIGILKTLIAGAISMKVNTAITFLLSGFSLLLAHISSRTSEMANARRGNLQRYAGQLSTGQKMMFENA